MELEKMKNELARVEAEAAAKAKAEKAEAQRLGQLQMAIEAEEKRLNSKDYKVALKAIDEMAVKAEAQKQSIYKTVEALLAEIETWLEILKKRKALARENRIDASDLKWAEMRIGGNVFQLQQAIEGWKKLISWREAFANMYKPIAKKR